MKLLLVTHTWHPNQGPCEWRMERFSEAWTEPGNSATIITQTSLDDSSDSKVGQRLRVLSSSRSVAVRVGRFVVGGQDHSLLGKIFAQGVGSISSLVLGLKQYRVPDRPDLVLATVPSIPSAFTAYILSSVFRTPLVIDLRDAWPDLLDNMNLWNSDGPANLKGHVYRFLVMVFSRVGGWLLSAVLDRADLILTTSYELRNSLRFKGHRNVETIMNVPAVNFTNSINAGTSERSGSDTKSDRAFRLLCAGTVGRAQGLTNFIYALRICKDFDSRISVRIVGKGAEWSLMQELARQLGVDVEFVSPVAIDAMSEHYLWCDACLVHLTDWEPLCRTVPSKLLEIMSLGIPVILSAKGEAAEIVHQTKAGEVSDPMNPVALAEILSKWSTNGAPAPNYPLVEEWLEENASLRATNALFLKKVSALDNS